MTKTLNRSGILWAIGVIQPCSALELSNYLSEVLGNAGSVPTSIFLQTLLMDLTKTGHVVRVHREPDLFSLSARGNHYLTDKQRRTRDASRLFLLKESAQARVYMSRLGGVEGLGDDSSPFAIRTSSEGTESNMVGLSVPQLRPYWTRYSKQFSNETGLSSPQRGNFIPLLSFANHTQLRVAAGPTDSTAAYDFQSIGLMMGISPRLIHNIVYNKSRNYREFTIKKSSGGNRTISSPRTFLKTIQKFIADYIFPQIAIHNSVHSFRSMRSIVSNASLHEGKEFVAAIDIVDFFGSITKRMVSRCLQDNGFDRLSADTISEISTLGDTLPQGAPTSPTVSNFILYNFDEKLSAYCTELGLTYTRYADDIAISGNQKDFLQLAVLYATTTLKNDYALRVNDSKTRIVSRRSRQVVTGVVVNVRAQPSRDYRRETRAAIHNLKLSTNKDLSKLVELQGRVSYLKSFPNLRDSKVVTEMSVALDKLNSEWRSTGSNGAPYGFPLSPQ